MHKMQAHLERLQLEKRFKIHVNPNSSKTEIKGFDESRHAFKVDVAAAPETDKANKEVVKFFSKLLKKKVRIVSGSKSRDKVLEIL